MSKLILRVTANSVIVVGLYLLINLMYTAATGALGSPDFARPRGSWIRNIYALGLSLPIPLHVISIGFFLQVRWLSDLGAKAARLAIIVTGCWLGVALGIRVLA